MLTWRNPLVALMCCYLLSVLYHNSTAYSPQTHACCVKYTRKPLPFQRIKGYVEQSSLDLCHKDAIIFYTVLDKKVCASAQDKWVKATLARLSIKLRMLAFNSTATEVSSSSAHYSEEPDEE